MSWREFHEEITFCTCFGHFRDMYIRAVYHNWVWRMSIRMLGLRVMYFERPMCHLRGYSEWLCHMHRV